jgi:hypothetical protein
VVEELLADTKTVRIPKELANQLRLVSSRLGTNVTDYATEALSQALRAHDMGSNLKETVDIFELVNFHRGAGLVNLPRNSLNQILGTISKSKLKSTYERSTEAGRWYAAYISSKLKSDSILPFLEKDFKVIWYLDEVEINEQDVMIHFRATCFNMSTTLTDLLLLYTKGVFEELGYVFSSEDVLPGLVSLKLIKTLN